jgi:hypothetical protein
VIEAQSLAGVDGFASEVVAVASLEVGVFRSEDVERAGGYGKCFVYGGECF